MNCCWKALEPIGDPNTLNPLTSSCILEFCVEYLEMASRSSCARVCSLLLDSLLRIDSPDVDVIILVLSVFIIAPKGTP